MPRSMKFFELEQVGVDDDVGRQRRFGLPQRGRDLVGQLAGIDVRLLDDGEDDAGLAVDAAVAALDLRAFLDAGHVLEQDGAVGSAS